MRDSCRTGAAAVAGLGLLISSAIAQDDPIVIGSSLPLTGNFSVSGEKHQQGFELCVELINEKGGLLDRPVELVISDNRSDTLEPRPCPPLRRPWTTLSGRSRCCRG